MARIALIFPPTAAVTVMPPIGLGLLAAVLRRDGHEVVVHDLARRHLSLAGLRALLARDRPDVIGLTVMTPNYDPALAVGSLIHNLPYRPTVLLGGPHVSAYPERSLDDFHGHFSVVREGEEATPALVRALETGGDPATIPGLVFRRDGETIDTGPAPPIEDLDALPWIAWDLLKPEEYPPIPHQLFVRELPAAPILSCRGCPFDCSFCATTHLFGSKIRRRDPADVVREMMHLTDRHGIREFHVEDDNPTLIRAHIEGFCEELIKTGRRWTWKFPNGVMVNTLDEPLVDLFARAGCYQISLGIETMSEATKFGKNVELDRVGKIIGWAKKRGVQTQGLFVIGLPGEDEATVRRSIHATTKLGLEFAHYGNFVPLPGSTWGDRINSVGTDFHNINYFTAKAESLTALTPPTAKSIQRYAILRFYLRPRILWNLLKMVKLKQIGGVLYTTRRYLFG